jgi:heat shock protein HtpX
MIWEQIRANRRRSVVLISVLAAMLTVMGYAAGEAIAPGGGGVAGLGVALVVFLVQMTIYFGGAQAMLLHGTGAVELERADNPRLFNIVEEMKIAAGLPFLPKVYLIDDPAPNAFAMGRGPQDSAVAVTTGLLHRLNRDELQGVIAHEIGHLRNQDVKFMTLAAVMLGSIIILSEIVWRTMRFSGRGRRRSDSRGGGQAQLIILLIAVAFAILGPLLAQLLYFACSRKREYLADASAAQFTRYPEGLASALEKIAGAPAQVAFASKATAPMFIINPLQADDRRVSLFSTHPPAAERIRILRNMTGAGLGDYEAAYRGVCRQGLIGRESLTGAAALTKRGASAAGPIEQRRETRETTYRTHGYLPVTCSCGLQVSVPETYNRNDLRCIRCGNLLTLPVAGVPPVIAPAAAPPRLQYRRTGKGWESFRCTCGRTVQISPAFSAPHIRCTNCARQIQIT